MRRPTARTIQRLAVTAVTAVATALVPAPWPSLPGDEPPATDVVTLEVGGWRADADGGIVSAVAEVADTVLVGAEIPADLALEVRGRNAAGWGEWMPLAVDIDGESTEHAGHGEHGHAETSADGGASAPLWLGRSDAIQFRADETPAGDVHVTAVTMAGDLGHAPGPRAGQAVASEGPDWIVPRSSWDPRGDCQPSEPPEYGDAQIGYVHHTVMYPQYPPEEADDVVRAICLFHVEHRRFNDVGYNFLVDRYGGVYEGRAGGMTRSVVGAHASGFNDSSFGVAVVGDFEMNPVAQPAVDALDRLFAWKFDLHDIDPYGTVVVQSTGGNAPKLSGFHTGAYVETPTILGHRDTGSGTLCPGGHLYATLDGMPDRVATVLGVARADAPARGRPHVVDKPNPVRDLVEELTPGEDGEVAGDTSAWAAVLLAAVGALVAATAAALRDGRRRERLARTGRAAARAIAGLLTRWLP